MKSNYAGFGKVFTATEILSTAEHLKSEDGENPEYDRALCELIGDLVAQPGEPLESAVRRVAKKIGAKNVGKWYKVVKNSGGTSNII